MIFSCKYLSSYLSKSNVVIFFKRVGLEYTNISLLVYLTEQGATLYYCKYLENFVTIMDEALRKPK